MTKSLIKYPGGKGRLAEFIWSFFPKEFNQYHEPFFGGGSMFFHRPQKNAYLSDSNEDLMDFWYEVQNHTNFLIKELQKDKYANTEEAYYQIRSWNPRNNLERAARFYYLNKTCFNGLYRVNKQGQFNTPYGKYEKPFHVDVDRFLQAQQDLGQVQLYHHSFNEQLSFIKENDLVYIDPPYHGKYDSYTSEGFSEDDHLSLYNMCVVAAERGAHVFISNSDTDFIHNLYANDMFSIHRITSYTGISGSATARGELKELLITNYVR